jgi:hypothetical protein
MQNMNESILNSMQIEMTNNMHTIICKIETHNRLYSKDERVDYVNFFSIRPVCKTKSKIICMIHMSSNCMYK